MTWDAALHKAIKAARLGREVLLKYYGRLEHIEHKFQAGLVSEADKESEKAIFGYLRQHFPQDQFLGEESTAADSTQFGDLRKLEPAISPGRWIVDPLDGTTNYIHRFPIFCISIGYEINGQMQLAVIDVPMLGEVYTAIRGQGAFMNGQKLQISQTKDLKDSLLATGFFNEDESNLQEQLNLFGQIVRCSRGIRRPGAAAYDLAMVARGSIDAFWEKSLQPWDSAAGMLLVEEAGGKVITYRGKDFTPYKNSIIAGNQHLIAELSKRFLPNLHANTN